VTPIRVLICDDHAPFREGLRALLSTTNEVEVVGEAPDGQAAVATALALQPDVVLMDLTMPGMSGVEATERVLARCPHIAVLVLTMLEDDASVTAALRAGALTPLPLHRFALEDIAAAHDAVEGGAVGKVLVDI
jgi:DNA-binding NarL/FixJ family response regulator